MAIKGINITRWIVIVMLLLTLGAIAGGIGYADEEEKRRVDISLSIFPRIVAVDNAFRTKLDDEGNARLLFLYDKNEERAQELADILREESQSIGGKLVLVSVLSVSGDLANIRQFRPTAIFLSERFNDNDLAKIINFMEEENRLVFSPFSGDVERGVTVGISVTSRIKPYFNLSALHRSKIEINALLMKMSKRYE